MASTAPERTRSLVLLIPVAMACGVVWFIESMLEDGPPRVVRPVASLVSTLREADAMAGAGAARDGSAPLVEPDAARKQETPVADPLRPLDPREERLREQAGRVTLCGLVLSPAGEPVAGAKLFVDGELVGRSDARGAYRIEFAHDVLGDSAAIAAIAESVGSCVVRLQGPGRRLDLTLETGHVVEGRTVEWRGGAPVAGATVDLLARDLGSGTGESCFALTARSDASGAFRFAAIPDGPIELRARAPAADTLAFRPYRLVDDAAATRIDLELRRRVALCGRFDPWPPRGFVSAAPREVRAWTSSGGSRWFDGRDFRAPIDGDGRFELLLPEYASYSLALAAGDEALWCETWPLPPDAAPVDLGRIALGEPTTLAGQLDVPSEVAALGVVVRGHAQCGEASIEFERRCAADGSFSIGPYPLERVEFELVCRHRVLHRAEPLELRRGDGRFDLGLLDGLPSWFGRVVDESGRPFAHASVVLEEGGKSVRPMVECDGDGVFWFNAGAELAADAAAPPTLVVTARGLAAHRFPVAVPATAVARLPDLVVRSEPTLRVGGVVREADGTPILGALVTLGYASLEEVRDVTGVDGRFEFRGLVVEGARSWPVVVELPDGRSFEPPPLTAAERELEWHAPSRDSSESR